MTNQMFDKQDLAGVVILAGGLSTRMGKPKALLTLPLGQNLLEFHVSHAKKLQVPIIIADNKQGFYTKYDDESDNASSINNPIFTVKDYEPENSKPKADLKHSAGPLSAVLAAMQKLISQPQPKQTNKTNDPSGMPSLISRWMIVVSCDSLINATDIWHLINQQINQSANVNQPAKESNNTKIYCLTDNKNLYPLLGMYQLDEKNRLKKYLDSGERRVMEFVKPICQSVTMPESWIALSNLNTPEQFDYACQKLADINNAEK